MHAYTQGGWAHRQRITVSTTFWLGKTLTFVLQVLLMAFEPRVFGSRVYQLSHPVTPCHVCAGVESIAEDGLDLQLHAAIVHPGLPVASPEQRRVASPSQHRCLIPQPEEAPLSHCVARQRQWAAQSPRQHRAASLCCARDGSHPGSERGRDQDGGTDRWNETSVHSGGIAAAVCWLLFAGIALLTTASSYLTQVPP